MNNPASIAQLGLTDDEIEAIALKHVAPGAKTLREIVPGLAPYQQSWQFQRIKAFLVDALAARRSPAAGEAQPAAYLTLDEEGSPCMLFFDVVEARRYCALGDAPEPLFRHAALQACAELLVRYCPGCGSVGPVESEYRNCCPDGGEARMVPAPLAEKCRDTFKIAVKALRADAAANEAMANQVPTATEEHTLRAMARNYSDFHLWDKLDSKTIVAAADEIRALRAALATRAQLPANGDAHG